MMQFSELNRLFVLTLALTRLVIILTLLMIIYPNVIVLIFSDSISSHSYKISV